MLHELNIRTSAQECLVDITGEIQRVVRENAVLGCRIVAVWRSHAEKELLYGTKGGSFVARAVMRQQSRAQLQPSANGAAAHLRAHVLSA